MNINKNKKTLIIKNPTFINPFLAYSIFWACSFVVYFFSPSKLFQNISLSLVAFCIITISISLLFAIDFNNIYKNTKISYKYKSPFLLMCILAVIYIIEFIYSKNIPLLAAFFSTNQSGYDEFGIPTLHVIVFTFSVLFCLKNFIDFLTFKTTTSFFSVAIILGYFLLIFSRGALMMLVLCFACVYLSTTSISLNRLLLFLFFGIIIMYFFGVLGNIRVSGKWNDSSLILYISQIEANPKGILTPFIWAEEYICCSLRNLNYTIYKVDPSYNVSEIIYAILPDFISKRVVGNIEFATQRTSYSYSTMTTYGNIYTCLGFFGMTIEYILHIVVGQIIARLSYVDDSYKISTISICFFIFAFSIFDPMIQYSGYSFSLLWGLLFGAFTLIMKNSQVKILYK